MIPFIKNGRNIILLINATSHWKIINLLKDIYNIIWHLLIYIVYKNNIF